MNPVQPIVELSGVTVSFPGTEALSRVDLRLFPGEVHAILGENGAGKSTVIRTLNGVARIRAGTIRVDGLVRQIRSPADSQTLGIQTVFQDVQLQPGLRVGENVMLGHERYGRFGIDRRASDRAAAQTLAGLGLETLDLDRKVASLSPSERQLVAIARAMVTQPRVLLLDEPTASLQNTDVARTFGVIRTLRERGVAIVFVSHFLDQVYAISDRMTVLRDGAVVGEYPTGDVDRAELISLMLGRDLEALQQLGSQRQAHRQEPEGAPVLSARELSKAGALTATHIDLYRGEIVGLAGLRGSGRTELGRLLAGVDKADSGDVVLDRSSSAGWQLGARPGASYLPEDRSDGGVIEELSVVDNIVLALQAARGWHRPISEREREEIVGWFLTSFDMPHVHPDAPVRTLSGGSQQKVLMARLIATRPRILILDEPTSGVDIGSRVEIQAAVSKLAAQGVSVVYISSDLAEVVRLADRIVVLRDGTKIGELGNGPAVTVDTVVEMIAADLEALEDARD